MEHSKEIELFCLDCHKLICVKCLISQGHQIHKIEDISSAFRFLSKRFRKDYADFSEASEILGDSVSRLKSQAAHQKQLNERYKANLKQVYLELKSLLKNKRNQMARSGERLLKENASRLDAYLKEVNVFREEVQKWAKMHEFVSENEDVDEEDMFYFLDKYAGKMDNFQEDSARLEELVSHSKGAFLKKLKPSDCKENIKLNLLGLVKKMVITRLSHKNTRPVPETPDNQSAASKVTSKKLKNLIRKSQFKSKKRIHLQRNSDMKVGPFKYVSNTLMMDSMSIQKNLKNLQKDLSGEQFRQNYLKINPRSGKTTKTLNKGAHPLQKLKQTNYQKNVRAPPKMKSGIEANLSKFSYANKQVEKLSYSKIKKKPQKLNWKKMNISSSRSQQYLLGSPLNQTTLAPIRKSPHDLRSSSHQKKLTIQNVSIDTKAKANSKIEFYRPQLNISKKKSNFEYEIIRGSEKLPKAIASQSNQKRFSNEEEFSLSIHENEEISFKSIKSKQWKKAPF